MTDTYSFKKKTFYVITIKRIDDFIRYYNR